MSYELPSWSDFQDHPQGPGDVGAEETSSSSSLSRTSLILAFSRLTNFPARECP